MTNEGYDRALALWDVIKAATGRGPLTRLDVIALGHAVRVLDERPRDAQGARLAMHDVLCINGADCGSRGDYARTNTAVVVALRKALAAEGAR